MHGFCMEIVLKGNTSRSVLDIIIIHSFHQGPDLAQVDDDKIIRDVSGDSLTDDKEDLLA